MHEIDDRIKQAVNVEYEELYSRVALVVMSLCWRGQD